LANFIFRIFAAGREGDSLSIVLGGYSFNGPWSSTGPLADRPGVYAIFTKNGDAYRVLDIGESATVKSRVQNHDRSDCWKRNELSGLYCAAYYTPNLQQSGRMLIEQRLRDQYAPTCGQT
jgi:hypothetical protein